MHRHFRVLIISFLTCISIFFLSASVYVYAAGTATNTTTKTCTNSKQGSYQECVVPGSTAKEIQNYTCERKMANGTTQSVVVPRCIVGGIFDPNDPEDIKCACCGDCRISRFLSLFVTISKWILGLSGTAALAMIIYGGFMWILSGGSPERIDKGKKALTGAVIGVIIVLGAWMLINFLLKTLVQDPEIKKRIESQGGNAIQGIQSFFKADQK